MRLIALFLALLLAASTALAQEVDESVIIVSPRVGEVIDVEEREQFNLFPGISGFQSAVFLRRLDGEVVARVTRIEEGMEQTQHIQWSEERLNQIGETIDHYEEIQAGKVDGRVISLLR